VAVRGYAHVVSSFVMAIAWTMSASLHEIRIYVATHTLMTHARSSGVRIREFNN